MFLNVNIAEEIITAPAADGAIPLPEKVLTVELLTDKHTTEVINFLAARPLHTFVMAGFIRDNGLINPLNRGIFYACRDEQGRLEGVALIGHATLIETRSEAAIEAFARIAERSPRAHVIMGEQERVASFWNYYAGQAAQSPRQFCRELMFEQRRPVEVREAVPGLRQATLEDLELVMPVQAQMAYEEGGVNPLEADPVGFRLRCARRIEQGRVWVWVEPEGRLIFKADVISDTPDVIYLEGIYVHPEERSQNYGLRCLSQLTRNLLGRAQSVILLVNERNPEAVAFYRRAGYKFRCYYDTIYLQQKTREC